ncbi:class I SAM-dependent methyltransferase [Lederbergia graminis]|uniref:Class I SAM-dependent methyltransferase n=1 Tax=Lederbergia graminis TaxID=735518 RepID=A0ABW0LNU5_9BACI
MSSVNEWNPDLYDDKMGYVSSFGKGVVELLQPTKGEKILDIGCGTGDLTYEISKSGANVTGMDFSKDMIEQAKKKYPGIQFLIGDAELFRTDTKYDAIFSNAALHWMKNAEKVVESINVTLRSGGRFVAEFGGRGNVQTLINGISEVLWEDYEIHAEERNPWYFPSIGEYSMLLENHGFHVIYAHHFERPTQLPDGENGIIHFLESFTGDFFQGFSPEEKHSMYAKVKHKIQPHLFKNGKWEVDYKRIRIVAIKD